MPLAPLSEAVPSVEALAGRLRDEVDLPTLAQDLTRVVDHTLRPALVGLWLRGDAPVRGGR